MAASVADTTPADDMSADVLRRAAALMRERAEALSWDDGWYQPDELAAVIARGEGFTSPLQRSDAMHIASWHPAVALAVADWLDMAANRWDQNFRATQQPSRGVDHPPAVHFGDPQAAAANADWHAGNALAVARAYLGEPS